MSEMVSVTEALNLLISANLPRRTETVPLDAALGRTLATSVYARVSRPPCPVSAMDGYAVRLEDVRDAGSTLTVIGEAPAGKPFLDTIGKGEAVRILTGAELPAGANHVIIQENTERVGETVISTQGYQAPLHIRAAGRDFSEGALLLKAGLTIGPAELATAAAANHADLSVLKPFRVGLLANGDELKPPGSALKRGEIVNSNPAGLSAMLKLWGAEPVDLGIAQDSEESIRHHIGTAENIDIFVPVGGASVGEYDFMRSAFGHEGFEPIFEKIAVKPGKPTWFSKREHQFVLGLPGNPASAFVCANLFLQPLIRGSFQQNLIAGKLETSLSANGNRENYLRARCEISSDGQIAIRPATDQDSSLIHPFLTSNALIRRRANAEAAETGTPIEVLLIGPLGFA